MILGRGILKESSDMNSPQTVGNRRIGLTNRCFTEEKKPAGEQIQEAKKIWSFNSAIYPSQSDERGSVLIIKKLKLKT